MPVNGPKDLPSPYKARVAGLKLQAGCCDTLKRAAEWSRGMAALSKNV